MSRRTWRGGRPPNARARRRHEAKQPKQYAYDALSESGKRILVGKPDGLGRILREKYLGRRALEAHRQIIKDRQADADGDPERHGADS